MKNLLIFVAILLASCAQPGEVVNSNAPAKFVVTEFAPNGAKRAVHSTNQYSESGTPPTIQFKDVRGNTVRIKGSYLVEER